jgi:hypothetical protein
MGEALHPMLYWAKPKSAGKSIGHNRKPGFLGEKAREFILRQPDPGWEALASATEEPMPYFGKSGGLALGPQRFISFPPSRKASRLHVHHI